MRIPRVHLFELEDQAWFPRTVRDFATDYLRFAQERLALHRPMVPVLAELLVRTRATRIVDLCAGGAGPVPALARALHSEGHGVSFVLTDLYPNLPAWTDLAATGAPVTWITTPVDARSVPTDLTGLRTIFNALHHFRPTDATAVLRNAVLSNQPIAVMELLDRQLHLLPAVALITPIAVLAVTPWIRPFRRRRLFWTYVVPLVPLTCWWDGLVSMLRAYTPNELLTLAASAAASSTDYTWRAGRVAVQAPPAQLTYLVGWPTAGSEGGGSP
jgi:hypothetical protein